MLTPIQSLLGYAAWAVFLAVALATWRSTLVLLGRASPNSFPGGIQHGTAAYWRLNRAHMNTLENLAIMATVVLAGTQTGVAASDPRFATLAQAALATRVVQSLIHFVSGSSPAVLLRFTAFLAQLVCFVAMGWAAYHAG